MTDHRIAKHHHATFEGIKQTDDEGNEFWLARELAPLLDYPQWRNFLPVRDKAREACRNSGQKVEDHFADVRKMVFHLLPAVAAGLARLVPHWQEISPLRIVQ